MHHPKIFIVKLFILTLHTWTSNFTCTNILRFRKYEINKTLSHFKIILPLQLFRWILIIPRTIIPWLWNLYRIILILSIPKNFNFPKISNFTIKIKYKIIIISSVLTYLIFFLKIKLSFIKWQQNSISLESQTNPSIQIYLKKSNR